MISINTHELVFNKTNYKDFVLGTCASVTSFMSAFLAIVPNILALQIIHYTFVVEMGLAIFIDNYKMIFVCFIILVILQMLWYKFGSCMMFREGESWGMEIPQYVSAWMWTIILGYKLLHRF